MICRSAGRITIPGNLTLGGLLRRTPRLVSIRRADHDTWERPDRHSDRYQPSDGFNPPGGSRYLGTPS